MTDKSTKTKVPAWMKFKPRELAITRTTKPPKEQWIDAVGGLEQSAQSGPFWRGDLYNKGVEWYGEDFASSIFDPLTMNVKTWQNNASVCGQIEPSRRRELSYSHHAEVAYLEHDEQDKFLQMAIDEGLSVRQLRKKIHQGEEDEILFAKRTIIERIGGVHTKLDNLIKDLPDDWDSEEKLLTEALHKVDDARNSANNRAVGEPAQIEMAA